VRWQMHSLDPLICCRTVTRAVTDAFSRSADLLSHCDACGDRCVLSIRWSAVGLWRVRWQMRALSAELLSHCDVCRNRCVNTHRSVVWSLFSNSFSFITTCSSRSMEASVHIVSFYSFLATYRWTCTTSHWHVSLSDLSGSPSYYYYYYYKCSYYSATITAGGTTKF